MMFQRKLTADRVHSGDLKDLSKREGERKNKGSTEKLSRNEKQECQHIYQQHPTNCQNSIHVTGFAKINNQTNLTLNIDHVCQKYTVKLIGCETEKTLKSMNSREQDGEVTRQFLNVISHYSKFK